MFRSDIGSRDILHGLATMRSETIPAEHVSRKRSRQSQLPNAVKAHDVGTNSTTDTPLSSVPPHLDAHFGYDPAISEMAGLNLSSGSDSNQNISHYPQPLGLETILPTAVDSGAVTTNDGAWFNIPMHFE